MAKLLSAREAKLQKKLIPLNIFVFILSLVAALSLFFMPILKVDIGKILSSPKLEQFVDDTLNETVGGSLEGSAQEGIDYSPVITNVVKNVLGKVKGSISITAFDASKIALSNDENKTQEVFDDLLYGSDEGNKGLITELIDSLINGLTGIFKTPEGKQLVEKTVVTTIASSVVSGLPEEVAGKVTEEKVEKLTETFVKINDVKNEEDVVEIIDEFVTGINDIIDEELDPEVVEEVKTMVVDMYKETIESLPEDQEFSLEALICVAVSNNVDLGEFDISEILKGIAGGNQNPEETPEASAVKHLAEGETSSEGEGGNVPDGDRVTCTTYDDLLKQMGFSEDNAELVDSIKTAVKTTVDEALKDMSEYFTYYGYLFYGMLAFIVPWLILALFSFFHIFAKNKRFMMWYVKLYSFIPGLIWVALTSFKMILAKDMVPQISELIPAESRPIIEAALDGISTSTWISGLCFVLLWLVSIFWAFPIKHKIRKERKACKRAKKDGTYSYYGAGGGMGYGTTNEENYGYGSTDLGSTDYFGPGDFLDDGLDDGGSDYNYGYIDDLD